MGDECVILLLNRIAIWCAKFGVKNSDFDRRVKIYVLRLAESIDFAGVLSDLRRWFSWLF